MKIEKKSIRDLTLADYNPRKDLQPGDPEYEKLKKSILEFDYVEPIIWNQRTGRVVGGHQQLKILQELGRTEVEVSVVDLPEDKEKALNLALNKISGDWDLPRLKDLLEKQSKSYRYMIVHLCNANTFADCRRIQHNKSEDSEKNMDLDSFETRYLLGMKRITRDKISAEEGLT